MNDGDSKRKTTEQAREAIMAAFMAEGFRPMFVRWAADDARYLYERIMRDLWDRVVDGYHGSAMARGAIEKLPEASCDDSNHRDFYVMLGLGVLSHAVVVADRDTSSTVAREQLDELSGLVAHLENELGIEHSTDEFEAAWSALEKTDMNAVVHAVHARAVQLSSRVSNRLGPAAIEHGWPVDRVREVGKPRS